MGHWANTLWPGGNVYGRCENSRCERHGKQILDPTGMKALDLLEELVTSCPSCSEDFRVENVYFYQCSWTIEYQKRGKLGQPCDPPQGTNTTDLETVSGSDYKKFGEGDLLTYRKLKLIPQK